jgi:hypothetical protein
MNRLDDMDPGRPKAVTNSDEQEVAVNHSTTDHGYDEPREPETPAKPEIEKPIREDESKKEDKPGKRPASQANKNF